MESPMILIIYSDQILKYTPICSEIHIFKPISHPLPLTLPLSPYYAISTMSMSHWAASSKILSSKYQSSLLISKATSIHKINQQMHN